MRTVMLVAMLVPLLVLAGCSKHTAKKPSPSDDSATAKPTPAVANDKDKKKDAKEDTPNWLTDPRFKPEKPEGRVEPKGLSAKLPWDISAPKGGWQGATLAKGNQPVQPAAQPGAPTPNAAGPAPGVGVLQPQVQPPATTPAPTFSPVGEADMKEVWVFIDNASGATGKMPPPVATFQALVAAESPAAKLVKNGSIILTGATQREGIWAYEARAVTDGGLATSQNGVERLTAAQLKARLGK
jgi:hypothetical protein